MAMHELGADNITVGIPLLTDLAAHSSLPVHQKGRYKVALDKLENAEWNKWQGTKPAERKAKVLAQDKSKLADGSVDYLQPGVLDEVNEADEVSRLRLKAGLDRFAGKEEESRQYIQNLQATLA
jgi:hypothetical protein